MIYFEYKKFVPLLEEIVLYMYTHSPCHLEKLTKEPERDAFFHKGMKEVSLCAFNFINGSVLKTDNIGIHISYN